MYSSFLSSSQRKLLITYIIRSLFFFLLIYEFLKIIRNDFETELKHVFPPYIAFSAYSFHDYRETSIKKDKFLKQINGKK